MQHICVFEDSRHSQLIPLVYTRPVFELRCGLFTTLERTIKHYPHATISLFCRNYLSDVLKEKLTLISVNTLHTTDDTCLFLNGRAIISLPVSLKARRNLGFRTIP